MSKARARKIKVILFDVDGVLTDGTLWFFPAPAPPAQTGKALEDKADAGGYGIHSKSMIEAKGFHAHDGIGVTLARLAGIKCGLITKRISETVALRARDLKLDYVFQGQSDKTIALAEVASKEGISEKEIAFVGDDIVDLPAMRRCGLAIAVRNAREQVKSEAHFVTRNPGGAGAARDAVEYVLAGQGRLQEIITKYIETRATAQKSGRNIP